MGAYEDATARLKARLASDTELPDRASMLSRDAPVHMTFPGKAIYYGGQILGKPADIISRAALLPLAKFLANDDPYTQDRLQRLGEKKGNIYFGDIVNTAGGPLAHDESDNALVGFLKGTGRFLGDVATDPLSYLDFGADTALGSLAKKVTAAKAEGIAVKEGSKVATRAAELTGKTGQEAIDAIPSSLEGRPLAEQIKGGQKTFASFNIPFTEQHIPLIQGKVGELLAQPFSALSRAGLKPRIMESLAKLYPKAFEEGNDALRTNLERLVDHTTKDKELTAKKAKGLYSKLGDALDENPGDLRNEIKNAFLEQSRATPARALAKVWEPFGNALSHMFSTSTGNKVYDKIQNKFRNLVMYRAGIKVEEGLNLDKELDQLAKKMSEVTGKTITREQVDALVTHRVNQLRGGKAVPPPDIEGGPGAGGVGAVPPEGTPPAGPGSVPINLVPAPEKGNAVPIGTLGNVSTTMKTPEQRYNEIKAALGELPGQKATTLVQTTRDFLQGLMKKGKIEHKKDIAQKMYEYFNYFPTSEGRPEDIHDFLDKEVRQDVVTGLDEEKSGRPQGASNKYYDQILKALQKHLKESGITPPAGKVIPPLGNTSSKFLKLDDFNTVKDFLNHEASVPRPGVDPFTPFENNDYRPELANTMWKLVQDYKPIMQNKIKNLDDLVDYFKIFKDSIIGKVAKDKQLPYNKMASLGKNFDSLMKDMEAHLDQVRNPQDIIKELISKVPAPLSGVPGVARTEDIVRDLLSQDQATRDAVEKFTNEIAPGDYGKPIGPEERPVGPQSLEEMMGEHGWETKPDETFTFPPEEPAAGAGGAVPPEEPPAAPPGGTEPPPPPSEPPKPPFAPEFGFSPNTQTPKIWADVKANARGLGKALTEQLQKVFPQAFPPGWETTLTPADAKLRGYLAALGSHITGGVELRPKALDLTIQKLVAGLGEPPEDIVRKLEDSYAAIDKVYITAEDRGLVNPQVMDIAKNINEKDMRQKMIEATSGVRIIPEMADGQHLAGMITPDGKESYRNHLIEQGELPRSHSTKDLNIKLAKALRKDFVEIDKDVVDGWIKHGVVGQVAGKVLKGPNGLNKLDQLLEEGVITETQYTSAVHALNIQQANAMIAAGRWKGNGNVPVKEFFHTDPVYGTTIRGVRGERARTEAQFFAELQARKIALPEDEAPASWLPVKQAELEGFRVPPEVARSMDRWYKFSKSTHEVNPFLKTYDKVQDLWKAWTLSIFPAYHVRNLVGNVWNNYLAGVTDFDVYKKAMQAQYPKQFGDLSFKSGLGYDYNGPKLMQEMKELGVVDRGFVAQDVPRTIEQRLAKGDASLGRENVLVKGGFKIGSAIENNARIAHYIDRLIKGDTPAEAALSVKKYLFDYSELTDFEQQVMKRIFPFYAWTRKNVPLQLQHLITEPARFHAAYKAQNELSNSTPASERYLPEWMSENFPLRIRKTNDGKYEYFLLNNWLPAADLTKVAQLHQLAVNMLSPIPKEFLQQAFNYDFFLKKQIEKVPGQKEKFLGMNLPSRLVHGAKIVRLLNEMDKMSAEDTDVLNKISGVVSGKTYLYDQTKGLSVNKVRVDDQIKTLKQALRKEASKPKPDQKEIDRIRTLITEAAKEY